MIETIFRAVRAGEPTVPRADRSAENAACNRSYDDEAFRSTDRPRLADTVRRRSEFLADATITDTSWVGLYHGGLQDRLAGKQVLELGPGDGLNALIMAALGAEVVASTSRPRTRADRPARLHRASAPVAAAR